MPFTSETAKLYGGPKPNAGRPTTEKLEAFAAAREAIKKQLAKDAKGIYRKYLKWMDEDPATCRHAVDKILPNEAQNFSPVFNIAFVRFDNTVQLQAAEVSTAVLASNGNGDKAGLPSVASTERQGQNGVKFRNFEDVS